MYLDIAARYEHCFYYGEIASVVLGGFEEVNGQYSEGLTF